MEEPKKMTAAEIARERRKQKILAQEANLNKGFIGTSAPDKQKEETQKKVDNKEFLMAQIQKRRDEEAKDEQRKSVSKEIVVKQKERDQFNSDMKFYRTWLPILFGSYCHIMHT